MNHNTTSRTLLAALVGLAVGMAFTPQVADAIYMAKDTIVCSAGNVTGTELARIHSITAGTATASKALIFDSNKHIDALRVSASGLKIGTSGSETTVTSTGTEINTVADAIASAAITSTPASGTCAVQFTFKNAAGSAISTARRIPFYVSDSSGVPSTALTSFATLTNGTVDTGATGVSGKYGWANCSAAGLLGMTVTASAGTYRLSFVLANQQVITPASFTVN